MRSKKYCTLKALTVCDFITVKIMFVNFSETGTVARLDCLYDSPPDALLLGHRVHVLVETQRVHFFACGYIAGNCYGGICYGRELAVSGKITSRFCAVCGGVEAQVYRNHEPVVAIVLSRDGNFSPIRLPEVLLDPIVPLK